MKELKQILAEAETFKSRRRSLAENLKTVDARHQEQLNRADDEYRSAVKNLEDEKKAAFATFEARAQKEISGYADMKQHLQSFLDPVMHLCPRQEMRSYLPNPSHVNEAEVNRLISMIREQGILAWLKRLLRIGGYGSREEMAMSVYRNISDAKAFCDARISAAQQTLEQAKAAQVTETRRKISARETQYLARKKELEQQKEHNRAHALDAIRAFDNSAELMNMRALIRRLRTEADAACDNWGSYQAPAKMPSQVQLCDVGMTLPDTNGNIQPHTLPLKLDLYSSNIVVFTTANTAADDSLSNQLVRKFLARMLKTIPPEACSYTIFDALRKGSCLGRLIDVTNVGTTDLNFDLYTANDSHSSNVSCADRRKYLCNRPADIVKFIGGKQDSLFAYNRESGDFEFPFTWILDFNFPDQPDNKLREDLKELFVNAHAAGYSFVFVTTPAGFSVIESMAKQYTRTNVLRVDCDTKIVSLDGFIANVKSGSSPSADQIYNFTTALKKYYEEGTRVDNRINTVFAAKGITQRTAERKLTIPMALDSRGRLVDIEFGGEGSVHGFISGGTNSGKSTLLHTIILSACLHYRPDDLEIWLIDYKQTEFHLYKKKTPPHVKLIGVSKTPDFTFSLLDKVEEEAARRTELMNRFNVQNLAEYRRHAGEPGYVNIPRLFLVIDEFHEMSQFVAANTTYKDKLENILREYRAQGITCLLADQAFSTGLSGLSPTAKNQIGLRIAMRNEASPQEIKDTLEVDRALYSDSMQRTISIMSQGEFIMKVYVRNGRGELTDIRLEKFKGLFARGEDISPISKALRRIYAGQFSPEDLIYVNTKDQVPWADSEPAALDRLEPLRYPNIRLYLGRCATLRPCFGLDLGRQPDENLSIVGGTAFQRWELLAAILESCRYRGYKALVFMAEYSAIMSDHGQQIRELCSTVPGAELLETTEQWCIRLKELEKSLDSRETLPDTVCIFIGLEIASTIFSRLPNQPGETQAASRAESRFLTAARYAMPMGDMAEPAAPAAPVRMEFNALPIIDRLFSDGARNGIRCVAEASVYRQFSKILKIRDMCRHKVAFSMSADDCMMYLGSSSLQKEIGRNALYGDGSKDAKKLLPYRK